MRNDPRVMWNTKVPPRPCCNTRACPHLYCQETPTGTIVAIGTLRGCAWSDEFLRVHENWSQHEFAVRHQERRPENFAFAHKGILCVGVHVLYYYSTNVHDDDDDENDSSSEEWSAQVRDGAMWLQEQVTNYYDAQQHNASGRAVVIFAHAYPHPQRYKAFYDTLVGIANSIDPVPILYLQGDSHRFKYDTSKFEGTSNILRVVVDRGGTHDPMLVTVDPNHVDVPFQFKRRALQSSE